MKRFFIIITLIISPFVSAQTTESNTSKIWTLEACLQYALENNISIKDATLNLEQAEVNYSASKSLRLPNLYGSASETFSNGNSIDPITSDYVTDQIYSTNVSLNSSFTLFQGNQINNQIQQNELLKNQSVFLQEEMKNNIILSILENYLQILYAKEGIEIAENNLIATEKEVERAKARLDAGSIALSDYTEAQSQAATNKYAIIAAKNTYQQYIIALKQLLELDPTEDIEIQTLSSDKDYALFQLDKLSIYNNALGILPEVNASKIAVEVQEKELEIAKGAYLPTLSLVSSLGSGFTSLDDNNFSDQFDINFNQRIGLSLNIPIFNRNQTKAAVKTAQINIEKAQIEKQTTEKEVYKKVETAYQNAVATQEQLIAAEASQDAAEQTYKLAQKKYELGALSTTDLVISQNTYTNAQQNYIQAKYLNILYNQLLQFYQGNDIKL
ncbi:TolC family protein [Winogradskyella eckloniae]|uniref:TolC family protein n=1 Tax=Winogradskyella eckloniae TaxID=1089306 RepID=UPI0015637F20|nr:TolC family protein [Winogradskyella eckloniae]NRD20120.1 TolC family protein [Winogradskyella eckloniae]